MPRSAAKDPFDVVEQECRDLNIADARLMVATLALIDILRSEDDAAARAAASAALEGQTVLGQPAAELEGAYLDLFRKMTTDWRGRYLDTDTTEVA